MSDSKSRLRRLLIVVAIVGVSSYVGLAVALDASRLINALRKLAVVGCGFILFLSIFNYLLRFLRWHLFIAMLKPRRVPIGLNLLYYFSGFAFTVSPAKAGEAVRAVYLRHHGVAVSESIAVMFVERLLDLSAMVILSSLILVSNGVYRRLLIFVSLAVIMIIVVICLPSAPETLEKLGALCGAPRIRVYAAKAANLVRCSERLLQLRPLIIGLAIGLVSWGAEGVGFKLICRALGQSIGLREGIGIYAVSTVAGSVAAFMPGGIGGMELVMSALLVSRGATIQIALVITLLCRLATLWLAVILGLAAITIVEGMPMRAGAERCP